MIMDFTPKRHPLESSKLRRHGKSKYRFCWCIMVLDNSPRNQIKMGKEGSNESLKETDVMKTVPLTDQLTWKEKNEINK